MRHVPLLLSSPIPLGRGGVLMAIVLLKYLIVGIGDLGIGIGQVKMDGDKTSDAKSLILPDLMEMLTKLEREKNSVQDGIAEDQRLEKRFQAHNLRKDEHNVSKQKYDKLLHDTDEMEQNIKGELDRLVARSLHLLGDSDFLDELLNTCKQKLWLIQQWKKLLSWKEVHLQNMESKQQLVNDDTPHSDMISYLKKAKEENSKVMAKVKQVDKSFDEC